MFKLPVCPYCNTIYRYKDVGKNSKHKECVCYHCGKKFRVSKKKFLILFLEIALICAIFDVISLYTVARMSFGELFAANVIFMFVGLFLRPFFIKFKKPDIPFDKTNTNINKKAIDTRDYNKKRK